MEGRGPYLWGVVLRRDVIVREEAGCVQKRGRGVATQVWDEEGGKGAAAGYGWEEGRRCWGGEGGG
jgi:hypothetical protein